MLTRLLLVTDRRRVRAGVGATAALALLCWIRLGPIPAELLDERGARRRSSSIATAYVLYEALSDAGTRNVALTADRLPPRLSPRRSRPRTGASVWHPGVDPIAHGARRVADLRRGRRVEGGSTITQQVAKLLLARRAPDRYRRGRRAKISEAVLALRLEHRFSEARDSRAVPESGRLRQPDDGRRAREPRLLRSARLDADRRRSRRFSPACRSGRPVQPIAESRQRDRAAADGPAPDGATRSLSRRTREARDERLVLTRAASPFVAPHFVEMALERLATARPPRIETTLDRGAAGGRRRHHQQPARPSLAPRRASTWRSSSSTTRTGEWLAWEGSGDYFGRRCTAARSTDRCVPRQPGSALKPFTYALAFEQGFTPGERAARHSVALSDRGGGRPLQRRATTTAGIADRCWRASRSAGSENVPAVALASQLGVPTLLRFLRARRLHDVRRATPAYYGLGADARQRRSAPRRARRRLRDVRARRRGWRRAVPAGREPHGRRARRDGSSRRGRAFWITDILSRRRRARVHLRPRRQSRVSVPGGGEDRHVAGVSRQLDDRATRATSPSACGSATSIARRCAIRPASPAPARSFTP